MGGNQQLDQNPLLSPYTPLSKDNYLYPELMETSPNEPTQDTTHTDTFEFVDGLQPFGEIGTLSYGLSNEKKRVHLTQDTKMFLNAVFMVRPFPNSTERKIIAQKCHMTAAQVRTWFSNRRARLKTKEN